MMRVLRSITELSGIAGPLVIAAGVFDGMHLGHRAVLGAAARRAEEISGTAVVLTFDPHPLTVLRPDQAPRLLTSTPHKLRLIAGEGFENVLLVTFDHDFSAMEAEDFVRKLSAASGSLAAICVGEGWKFGRGRRGDGALLRAMGKDLGFETIEVSPVAVDGAMISSTSIRRFVEAGQLESAARLLGRRYSVLGTVQRGEALGRQLGFPTANLATHSEQFPPDGVYAVHVRMEAGEFGGVANVGNRPTVSNSVRRLLEVHLLDFSGDLYGQEIEAVFIERLRGEQKFPDVGALRSQIALDADHARRLLSDGGKFAP
jgi:riboflavin kinase/FMN adenylyltransferase